MFSPLKHESIRLACGLDPANYDAGRPPTDAVFLAKGRSMVKVEAVLKKFLAPVPNNWDPISVYASQELVRDMIDLKFGWGNENTHDTCHRGISPFTVLQVSTDQRTKRRKTQERAHRQVNLTRVFDNYSTRMMNVAQKVTYLIDIATKKDLGLDRSILFSNFSLLSLSHSIFVSIVSSFVTTDFTWFIRTI